MNAKPIENHDNQQERTSRQKRVRRDSSGDDELTTDDYEKEMLANSRTRDLEPGAKKAKASSPAQKTAKSSPGRERGPRGARGKMREQIKRVAESQFIARGYDGTTMRSIAKGAGCDPAMVSYYFGSKQRLFRDCFDLPLDPLQQILQLWEPGLEGIADRLLDFAFTLYEERLTKDRMKALMRALITDSETTQRFRAYMSENLLKGGAEVLNTLQIASGQEVNEELETNFQALIEILMSMIYGVATMRYIVQLEPVASMERSELQNRLAPILQTQIENLAHEVFPSLVAALDQSENASSTGEK
ncbi:TetR/AcrR family transcriptional regulator [Varibaculum cambriense]|uniref:TetR/AcrR family transcriptional regulator n=1 Tax=Varibaculum cambriense TaxID=184870 RepID=UPI00241DBEDA|nr:TetR/AcrR family transcriptional regulator [Varibaculum cambriense]MDU1052060.1 TetR family transcriptional regulator [Varibaculum cambriense]